MNGFTRAPSLGWLLFLLGLFAIPSPPLLAQPAGNPVHLVPAHMTLTLEEAKQRALDASKLLHLASLNAQSKAFAVRAVRADYFPKVSGTALYLHFNNDLGKVLTTQGRSLSGPRGTPLLTFPATTIQAAVFNQDSSVATIGAVQPITDLLKVRQGVNVAQADEGIARAQLDKGVRDLVSGVAQLYWGLLAARRIQAGAAEGLQGAELMARTGALEGRIALMEAKQALQQVEKQVADLQAQLNALLDLPPCTTLELTEPPLPPVPFACADDVTGLALAASPEIREAQQTVAKAKAALAAGKLDYVPSIAVVGGYVNQTAASYIQQDIGYVGVVGSYTFVDWGKRRNVINERDNLVIMATLKLQQTEDDVRQKAQKAFRDLVDARTALKSAQEMAALRKEAEKAARTPATLVPAAKARMLADVDAVKADLAYREAYVQLMSLIGKE